MKHIYTELKNCCWLNLWCIAWFTELKVWLNFILLLVDRILYLAV